MFSDGVGELFFALLGSKAFDPSMKGPIPSKAGRSGMLRQERPNPIIRVKFELIRLPELHGEWVLYTRVKEKLSGFEFEWI
jgi:hypothetical protein